MRFGLLTLAPDIINAHRTFLNAFEYQFVRAGFEVSRLEVHIEHASCVSGTQGHGFAAIFGLKESPIEQYSQNRSFRPMHGDQVN